MNRLEYLRQAEEFVQVLNGDNHYWFCEYFSKARSFYPVRESVDFALKEMKLYEHFQKTLESSNNS